MKTDRPVRHDLAAFLGLGSLTAISLGVLVWLLVGLFCFTPLATAQTPAEDPGVEQTVEYVLDKQTGEFHRRLTVIEGKQITRPNLEEQLVRARADLARLQRLQAKGISDVDAMLVHRLLVQRDRKIVPLSVSLPAEMARVQSTIQTMETALGEAAPR